MKHMVTTWSRPALAAVAVLAVSACSSSTMPSAPSRAAVPAAAAPAPAADPIAPAATARYRVTFTSTWSAATHPDDFPASAHFSPLVGGTHAAQVVFWREGAPASDGIKDMAERGQTSTLSTEITAAIAAGTAEHLFTGGAVAVSPGAATAELFLFYFDCGERNQRQRDILLRC